MKSLPLLLVSLLAISAGCDTSEETPGDRSPPTSDGGPAAFDGGPSSDAMRDRDGQPASDGTTAPPAADAGQTDGAPGPVHPHAFELRSGESSVHLRARDVREPDFQNLDQAQYSARITFLDDAGETLRTVEAQLGGQTANGPGWEKLLWWPTRDVPVSAEIELRRSVPGGGLDETELVRTLTETIVPMPVVADQCMTNA